MRVELIACTPNAEDVCNMAAMSCITHNLKEDPEHRAVRSAMASGHDSVLEHAQFTFRITGISRVTSHQLVRHRIASYSQLSQRYSRDMDTGLVLPGSIRDLMTDPDGSASLVSVQIAKFMEEYDELMDVLRDAGVPQEDSRYFMPQGTVTDIVVSMNARELRKFFALRVCTRAQWEIREVANSMLALCKETAPALFENAGPSCKLLGHCPEKRSCGKVKENEVKE